ncbi:MAG: hypothetical protein ACRDL0_06835 [Thermoleophilaceae bacterium]
MERLARHLGAFGEITITKLEPERTVAWEGEGASGTVSIEPSGWGTKVTLTAQLEGEAPVEPEPEPEPGPEPGEEVTAVEEPLLLGQPAAEPPSEPLPRRRRGFLAWLFRPRTSEQGAPGPVAAEPEPVAKEPVEPEQVEPEPVAKEPVAKEPVAVERVAAPEPDPVPAEAPELGEAGLDPEGAQAILDEALDALGAAHHRPFSRG